MKTARSLALIAAAGCAASAYAQPTVVTLSGATLMENFLKAPAATNDWLDVDGDGNAGSTNGFIDNLAPALTTTFGPDDHWVVTYRVSGSVNGYNELVQFGPRTNNCGSGVWQGTFVTGDNALVSAPNVVFGNTGDGPIQNSGASAQYFNTILVYSTTGTPTFSPLYTPSNVSGLPIAMNLNTLKAVTGAPAAGGYRVDVAPVDVPSTFAVQGPGSASNATFTATPGSLGYGLNPRTSVNPDGTTTGAGFNYNLVDLGDRNLNIANPDCNTIFDTPLAWVPIAALVNYGVGMEQITQSELGFLFSTGRLMSGENVVAITREIGSGTRNGFNNTTGIDPSWGVGENIGGVAPQVGTTGDANILGGAYRPSNKVGSGDLETTLRNTRLGFGYTGAERFNNTRAQYMELLSVKNDLSGGTQYTRPTLDANLNNNPATNGALWAIGGPGILATVGDPRNQTIIGGEAGNTNPPMANAQAAAFVNNISRSIESFVSVPANVQNVGMPGEWAATLFVPIPARQYQNSFTNPTQLTPNPTYNASLGAALAPISALAKAPVTAPYGSVTMNGQTPNRKTGVVYSDGVANGANYIKQDGTILGYNVAMPARNRIAGDFNGDGLRNLNDATEMLKAYRQRNGGPVWTAPSGSGPIAGSNGGDAVIEILGDFNGDGSFDIKDVRYWADGLAIDPATGKLDRKKGFEAIDNAWFSLTGNNNFFGTTIAGGKPYVAGYSAADVAGSGGIARGWAPVGADGVIDGVDAAYIEAQFVNNPFVTDGAATWSTMAEAVGFDLSGDITGDLVVDQADLALVNSIIGTCYANCDGSTSSPTLNVADFGCFLSRFAANDPYANCDGSTNAPILNVADFGCFLTKFAAGCP